MVMAGAEHLRRLHDTGLRPARRRAFAPVVPAGFVGSLPAGVPLVVTWWQLIAGHAACQAISRVGSRSYSYQEGRTPGVHTDNGSGFPRGVITGPLRNAGVLTPVFLGVALAGVLVGVAGDRPGRLLGRRARVRPRDQGWAGSPLIRNGTVTMLDATPRSLRSAASMRPSLFRSRTTFGASLKMPS